MGRKQGEKPRPVKTRPKRRTSEERMVGTKIEGAVKWKNKKQPRKKVERKRKNRSVRCEGENEGRCTRNEAAPRVAMGVETKGHIQPSGHKDACSIQWRSEQKGVRNNTGRSDGRETTGLHCTVTSQFLVGVSNVRK